MSRTVSPMNPFFVLQRTLGVDLVGFITEFYAVDDDGRSMWVIDPYRAMLFMSLFSADQVSQAEGGDIVAITNLSTYEGFRE